MASLLFVGGLGWCGWTLVQALLRSAQQLQPVWSEYLGASDFAAFVLRCSAHATCSTAMLKSITFSPFYLLPLPLLVLMALTRPRIQRTAKPPGGARWAEGKDLGAYLKDSTRQGYLGLYRGALVAAPEHLRCAHTLVIGGPGAGKSTGYFKPNLLMDALQGVSAIVFDLKYPDPKAGFVDMLAPFEVLGRTVQLFVPFEPFSLRLPLLLGAERLEGASEIAELMISRPQRENNDEFYRNLERQLLTGLLLASAQEPQPSLRRVFRLLLSGQSELRRYLMGHPHPEVKASTAHLFDLEHRVLTGLVAGLAGRLQIFDHPLLDWATSPKEGENLELGKVFAEPTLLYIGLPQEELQGKGQVLLQLLKRVLDRKLLEVARAHGGVLPIHTSVYLDEFANFGPLPQVAENLATLRSRRVAYHLALQNLAQGEVVYGREGFKSFVGNLQHQVWFPRFLRSEDARTLSQMLGYTTARDTHVHESYKRGWLGLRAERRLGQGVREVARPLLAAEEMLEWPDGEAVVILSGTPPLRSLLPRVDQARVRGVRNPLHRFHKLLRVQPQALIRLLTLQQGLPEEPPAEPTLLEPLPALKEWLEGVLNGARVVLHKNNGHLTAIGILADSLPEGLRQPVGVGSWVKQGWLRVIGNELRLTGKGLGVLGSARIQSLVALEEKGPLLVYVREHALLLEGHPLREAALKQGQPVPPARGRYQERKILLPREELVVLYGKRLPRDARERRLDNCRYLEIPLGGEHAAAGSAGAATAG
jgi:type IV secretion system protein VirD4